MANNFTAASFFLRWVFAAVLVISTYNPSDYSYISWVLSERSFTPLIAILGLILLTGWIIYVRATFMSMGWLGVILGSALFACIIWLFVDLGWMTLESTGALSWLALILTSLILATGMSWSHVRKRLTGQIDVDDVED
ncbi:hypothetical protein H2508_06975 [Parahaliea sp. F7430]|uniref:Uncharacterized protein n=1 Tax=Sediminihaliea albiluteola TaxID=2758564 RepID=A0A7W2YJQ0_9GAMM|nr:DUF6524 family protein [Sediminihaliea albiluteola]MBA6412849.1 hypothetical protein [Sediminihaliea albiluteola]